MAITAPVRIRVVRQPKVRIRLIPKLVPTDGASAYEVAVENGFVGSESEWLDSLRGNVSSPDDSVTSIIRLTQAEYDALTPDETTLYIIIG